MSGIWLRTRALRTEHTCLRKGTYVGTRAGAGYPGGGATARLSTLYYVYNFFLSRKNYFKIKSSKTPLCTPRDISPGPQVWCLTLEILNKQWLNEQSGGYSGLNTKRKGSESKVRRRRWVGLSGRKTLTQVSRRRGRANGGRSQLRRALQAPHGLRDDVE